MIKKILTPFFLFFIKRAYKNFPHEKYAPRILFRYALRQKFFGPNKKVPWPVHHTSQIIDFEKIDNGTRAPGMGKNCYLDARNGIILGENVWTGPNISIISMNHDNQDYKKYIKSDPVRIGKNSWLAANCIILPSVELGEHTIVAAGAVVTKSFPNDNQVIAGNPAKIVKKLGPYNEQNSTT
ncbi:MAG: acyltransferase [Calditrichaeota bacterium]|nr:MAG: acyltransferase [Calditrichota bacterium]MBL1207307.1 acyltransferase [Calditrichota bacterium]NOG47139.1 acyltransferase [Calditrichota bacterium]